MAVTNTDQTNNGNKSHVILIHLIFSIVVIKLIAPNIEEAPARCKLKIAKSTELHDANSIEDNGGYTVHPVPAPASLKADNNNNNNEGGNNQKLILFNRGKAISGAPIIIGTNQLPKPPINVGITMKNIIIKACAVITTLYTWALFIIIDMLGPNN
jgi:hypothetical protein